MNEPMYQCPRFPSCSVNVCPLDPEHELRSFIPGDEKCDMRRSVRERIAGQYPELLPAGGLLPRDRRSDQRKAAWDALPEEEKARRLARLKKTLALAHKARRNKAA